jgi:ACS family sodium-dependent inorganic phosphate cotransporter
MMIGQMFLGCDRVASVTFFTVALTMNGAVCGGYLGNGLDIAPNFSGIIASLPYNFRNISQIFTKLSN